MIRPVTVATFLLACGSGLYLYQSKHEVQVLDRTIERSVRDTNVLREQSRLLSAEWTMLSDQDRLRQFSDTYLQLKTIAPSQYTNFADLDNRLPAPRIDTPAQDPEEDQVTVDNGPQPIAAPGPAATLPVPPVPAHAAPAVASAPHAVEIRVPEAKAVAKPLPADSAPHAATIAEARLAEARLAASRVMEARSQRTADSHAAGREPVPSRPIVLALPRPVPVNAPAGGGSNGARPQTPSMLAVRVPATLPAPIALPNPVHVALVSSTHVALVSSTHVALATPAPVPLASAAPVASAAVASAAATAVIPAPGSGYGGSLLGMARGGLAPSPRPTPVNASYRTN